MQSVKVKATGLLVETLLCSPEGTAAPRAGEVASILFDLRSLLPRAGAMSIMSDTAEGNLEVYKQLLALLNVACACGFDKELIRVDVNTLLVRRREPFPT